MHDNDPFFSHEYLSALERYSVATPTGDWIPRHIALYSKEGILIGAVPLYEKHNNHGEFVFDNVWAEAYKSNGFYYYPRLVCSIPYTPATGQRFLAVKEREQEIIEILLEITLEFYLDRMYDFSGFHCLFPLAAQQKWLEGHNFLTRHTCQFHWHNNNYQNFDDFLDALIPEKRENIRQERRNIQQSNITLRHLNGDTATTADWKNFAGFCQKTFAEKNGLKRMGHSFFQNLAQSMSQQVLLILADNDKGECIAGTLMFISDTTLYGRYWGSTQFIDELYFEICYYQGIEYCIEHGLQYFDPGPQGEHKVERGFIPIVATSCHWMSKSPFKSAIEQFIQNEKEAVQKYISDLTSPYKETS